MALLAARIVDGSLRDPNSGHGVTGLRCGFAALDSLSDESRGACVKFGLLRPKSQLFKTR